jgi:hypothetical protein
MARKKKPLPPEVAEAYSIISKYNASQMTPEQRAERARKGGLAASKNAANTPAKTRKLKAQAGKTSWASLTPEQQQAKIEAMTAARRAAREKRNGESQ